MTVAAKSLRFQVLSILRTMSMWDLIKITANSRYGFHCMNVSVTNTHSRAYHLNGNHCWITLVLPLWNKSTDLMFVDDTAVMSMMLIGILK